MASSTVSPTTVSGIVTWAVGGAIGWPGVVTLVAGGSRSQMLTARPVPSAGMSAEVRLSMSMLARVLLAGIAAIRSSAMSSVSSIRSHLPSRAFIWAAVSVQILMRACPPPTSSLMSMWMIVTSTSLPSASSMSSATVSDRVEPSLTPARLS